jgi:hypothetical protein
VKEWEESSKGLKLPEQALKSQSKKSRSRTDPQELQCLSLTVSCLRCLLRGADDEYVDEAAGALLPAGQSCGVEDANERADEVVRIGVCAEIAAIDGAFDRRDEGSVNETTRAFDQSHRAARDGVHGRDDERFGGHMVDEEKHPGAERFKRWQGGGEALFGCCKLFDFATVGGFEVTSGVGLTSGAPGHVRTEKDLPVDSPAIPRRPEHGAQAVAEKGVHVAIVRLPQVHDTRKQGLVPLLTQTAREKGVSAYVGDGANRWAAAPLKDVAHLYRLAIEKTGPGVTVYNAVQEEGVSAREIAEAIGKGLRVPAVSIAAEKAGEHFGSFAHFAALDMPASSEWTRKALGWEPTGPGLIEDLTNMKYF